MKNKKLVIDIEESIETKRSLLLIEDKIHNAIQIIYKKLSQGGKVLLCGNGGSASDAQHFSGELLGRFEMERPPLAAVALTTDTSTLTAVGNDYDYSQIFSKQVSGLGRANDILFAISTSGNSANVIEAIRVAQEKNMRVIALTGKDGGKIRQLLNAQDIEICAPAKRTCRVQEIHILVIHALCDMIDSALFETTSATTQTTVIE